MSPGRTIFSSCLDTFQLVQRAVVDYVAGVQRGGGFEKQDPAFFVSHRLVLYAARNDDEFAFFNPIVVVAKFHAEAAFHDEEQFVFLLVVMEDKFSFELVEFDLLAVEFGGNVGLPVFGDFGEFLGDVDFGHACRIIPAQKKSQEMWTATFAA